MAVSTEQLIAELGAELTPVRPLRSSALRTLVWLGLVAGMALAVAATTDLARVGRRLADAADMLAVAGSTLTAILAAYAAFQLSLPDRSRYCALLPLPALALWLGGSGLGCLRTAVVSGPAPASIEQATHECLPFVIAMSLPLAVALLLMLRRARPLQPNLVAVLGGLAVAAAAASLLCLNHPFDTGAVDLLVHAAAVLIVVLAIRWAGPRLLQ